MIKMITGRTRRRGFTITELLVVIGLIVLLIGILLPALAAVKSSGLMTKSMSNMRQIATWMQLYSNDNRDFILPSQFDYSDNSYHGKVRSEFTAGVGQQYQGTWCDILWTVYEVGTFPDAVELAGHDYRYDSPDLSLYEATGDDTPNPFRSAAENTADFTPSGGGGGGIGGASDPIPKPFGDGAREAGRPGLFAANNFFDARPPEDGGNGWFTTAQIKIPSQSMYLVDSFVGEVIEDELAPFHRTPAVSPPTIEVDFRYAGDTCLMLFLDGHVQPEGIWKDLDALQGDPNEPQDNGRGIRIQKLTQDN